MLLEISSFQEKERERERGIQRLRFWPIFRVKKVVNRKWYGVSPDVQSVRQIIQKYYYMFKESK